MKPADGPVSVDGGWSGGAFRWMRRVNFASIFRRAVACSRMVAHSASEIGAGSAPVCARIATSRARASARAFMKSFTSGGVMLERIIPPRRLLGGPLSLIHI